MRQPDEQRAPAPAPRDGPGDLRAIGLPARATATTRPDGRTVRLAGHGPVDRTEVEIGRTRRSGEAIARRRITAV